MLNNVFAKEMDLKKITLNESSRFEINFLVKDGSIKLTSAKLLSDLDVSNLKLESNPFKLDEVSDFSNIPVKVFFGDIVRSLELLKYDDNRMIITAKLREN